MTSVKSFVGVICKVLSLYKLNKYFYVSMNLSNVTGRGVIRDIMRKFLKIFYFLKYCSELGQFFALKFGDYNIHNNIKFLKYSPWT